MSASIPRNDGGFAGGFAADYLTPWLVLRQSLHRRRTAVNPEAGCSGGGFFRSELVRSSSNRAPEPFYGQVEPSDALHQSQVPLVRPFRAGRLVFSRHPSVFSFSLSSRRSDIRY